MHNVSNICLQIDWTHSDVEAVLLEADVHHVKSNAETIYRYIVMDYCQLTITLRRAMRTYKVNVVSTQHFIIDFCEEMSLCIETSDLWIDGVEVNQ